MQTNVATRKLRELGHDVAILCHFGIMGAKTEWGDIPLYPNNFPGDYGVKAAPSTYQDFNADLLITLVDIWVMGQMDPTIHWCPWIPVDHNPIPPLVLKTAQQCPGIIKPIAMSKFGMKQLGDNGVDCYYIPHTVNTKLFKPDPISRERGRDRYGWNDKFVIGCVATNQAERKNWNVMMQAVAIFEKNHPGEIVFYMHTRLNDQMGLNLRELKENLGMNEYVKAPSETQLDLGISEEIMAATYNVFDVFLLPSKGEGFGIPYIEAQATGVPVIMTKCTGHEELMGGGWFIENLRKEWSGQGSWRFDCDVDEVVDKLELAYQAKKGGEIVEIGKKAREKAMEYEEETIYSTYWPSVLADIEKRFKQPKNMEGIQKWRLAFIPQGIVPRKVLDLGSGLTIPYKPYLNHLGEYVAVDNRSDGSNGIMKADAHKLPFRDKEFGFLWCSEMLEHVDNPEKVVREAKRVSNHGVIIFSTPKNPTFFIDPGHKVVDPRKVHYAEMGVGDGILVW